jgi:fimbrial chaperone protein
MPSSLRLRSTVLNPALAALVALSVVSTAASAGEFVILPLRVSLDRSTRATEIVVRNEDKVPLRMQVEGMSWRQDASGKDVYEPAEGLLYFPRSMEIPPGESRIVRVGVKAAPVTREETYRLFIEELPSVLATSTAGQGASLQVLLRVGVPVFVAPAQPDRRLESVRLQREGRRVEWVVSNPGNVYVRAEQAELTGAAADGTRLFTLPSEERYFLAGVTKSLTFEIPEEMCGKVAALEASIAADTLNLKRKIDVPAGSCQ